MRRPSLEVLFSNPRFSEVFGIGFLLAKELSPLNSLFYSVLIFSAGGGSDPLRAAGGPFLIPDPASSSF